MSYCFLLCACVLDLGHGGRILGVSFVVVPTTNLCLSLPPSVCSGMDASMLGSKAATAGLMGLDDSEVR